MTHNYLIPAKAIEHCYEIKKSRFIARVCLAENRQQAMLVLQQAKVDYKDARHHCWAYLLGDPKQASSAAFSDDGEPSGTAGKPMLNVLNHRGIGNIMVVISRYFGGVKLGAGGLVRAYSAATQLAVEQTPTLLRVAKIQVLLCCDYAIEPDLRRFIRAQTGDIISSDYQQQVSFVLDLPIAAVARLRNFCAGKTGIDFETTK